jgi:two-component system chemotaxis sensor kinase CheA
MDAKIFDTLLEPIFILNQEKKILYCNEPAALLADLTVRKILRSPLTFDQLFQFTAPIEYLNTLNQISDPTPYQEVGFSLESGKTGKVQITLQPFPEINAQPTWIVFFRDVTLEETLQKKYRAELEQKEDVIKDLQKAQAELEEYSKNLEKMVSDRTAELRKLNQMMAALLDSLGQGFFIFDKNGLCLEIYSKACETTVETKPPGQKVWEVMRLSPQQVPGFQKWLTTVFAEMLPFEDLAPLGPQSFPHSQSRSIQLQYYPLRGHEGSMDGVVVVATDITDLVHAQQVAETERAHAQMILSLVQHRRQVSQFIQEAEGLLKALKKEFQSETQFHPEDAFRFLHTLKGGAASFSIKTLADQCHLSETLLSEWKQAPSPESWQKLSAHSLKIEEIFQEFLQENEPILGSREKMSSRWVEIPAENLARYSTNLPAPLRSQFIDSFLTEPVKNFFEQYEEVIATVAEREGKLVVPLKFSGEQLKVIPELYSTLFSTCIHAFRNAVDHGIEFPSVRQERGKPEAGSIQVSFVKIDSPQGSRLRIKIQDDGGGIDPQKIRERLIAKGIDVSAESDEEVIQHIFDAEFSTKDVVTETSGRGVGMDAIAFAAKKMGGKAWVSSLLEHGTTLWIEVPYLTALPASSPQAA